MKKAAMATNTPPRRTMKQQTLLSMNLTPNALAAAAADDGSAKRFTRASSQQSPTPSPARTRSSPTRAAAVAPQSPRLRPRRSSTTSAALTDPYKQYTVDALRDECVRRGIAIQSRDQPLGKPPQTKAQFIELLQEADMLSMFARKSNRPGKKRAARAIDLTLSPPTTQASPARPKAVTPRPATTKSPKQAKRPAPRNNSISVSKPVAAHEGIPPQPLTGASIKSIAERQLSIPSPSAPTSLQVSDQGLVQASVTSPSSPSADLVRKGEATISDHARPGGQQDSNASKTTGKQPRGRPAQAGSAKGPRGMRAGRGCRLRLINVLLSPDFSKRWHEMSSPVLESGGVNAFWQDVHLAYLCQNSFYDSLHFQDKIFQGIAPDVIKAHSAHKLQQTWTEIVVMYRRASNVAAKNDASTSFLQACPGRLDVLYLHMGLMAEPDLLKIIVGETTRPKSSSEGSSVDSAASARSTTHVQGRKTGKTKAATEVQASASSGNHRPQFVELQNPEMLPDWLIEDQKRVAAERGLVAQTSFVPLNAVESTPVSVQATPPPTNFVPFVSEARPAPIADVVQPDAVQSTELVLHSSAFNNIDDDYLSSDYETEDRPVHRKAPQKNQANLKRARAPSTDALELSASRELVAHPQKRMHTSTAVTTTMTRSQEITLPPDEFDVLHNRLRKINESIDQCYKTLSNGEAILNDMHRQDVESDLRFYLGIKKRIQEQIVMFMHGY